MCRFLLVKSKEIVKPEKLLKEFALMCQKSHAPDGDWQGDGWGIAWQEKGTWKLNKSLLPVWEDQNKFASIPPTKLFVVFNGMIRGVQIPRVLEGQIGAQKIFSFLREEIKNNNVKNSLKILDET